MKDTLFTAVVRDDKEWTYETFLVNNTGNSITFSGETGMYEEDLVSSVAKIGKQTLESFSYVSLEKGNRNTLDFTIWYRLFIASETYRFSINALEFIVNKGKEVEIPVLNQSGQFIELQKEPLNASGEEETKIGIIESECKRNKALRKDSEWGVIDGELCRVIKFTPLSATINKGKVIASTKTEPYASIIFECKKLPQKTEGYICHKVDFQHLWAAFKDRGIQENEEMIICYSKKNFKKFLRIFSAFLPRLVVMICPKGAFDLMTDPSYRPELKGEARFLAERPIVEWKSEAWV